MDSPRPSHPSCPSDEQDLQDLHELQAELAATERAPWEPRCVARAFRGAADPFIFTMQAWIDLEAAESPILRGRLPEIDDTSDAPLDALLRDYRAAFAAFGHHATTPENCTPEELLSLGRQMIRAVAQGFEMQVKLARPDGTTGSRQSDDGMGAWLPIFACLVGQLGLAPGEARALPVAQAFAFLAAHRVNTGWHVIAEPYALREVAPDHGGPRDE